MMTSSFRRQFLRMVVVGLTVLLFSCMVFVFSFTVQAETVPPAETAPLNTAAIVSHGPYLCDMDEHGVTVVWTTAVPAKSWVELTVPGTDEPQPYYETSHGAIPGDRTLHKVRIFDLTPNTEYRYTVATQALKEWQNGWRGIFADKVVTPPSSFRTFDTTKKNTSFVVLNDVHEDNTLMRTLLKTAGLQENTAATLSPPSSVDFVVYNGDMAHRLNSEEHLFRSFQDTGTAVFGKTIPMFYARGNHETRGVFANRLMDYFPTPNGMFYYVLRQGPVACLVLDAGEDKPDGHQEYYGLAQFDQYRTEEAQWLAAAVRSKMFRSAPFRVVLIHMPPTYLDDVPEGLHGASEAYRLFAPILNQANIDCQLSGHLHRTLKNNPVADKTTFPALIASNKNCFLVEATEDTLRVFLCDTAGNKEEFFTKTK